MMRPVLTAAEYRDLRNSEKQKMLVKQVRNGGKDLKTRLVQMNYSCLPADDSSEYNAGAAGCGPLKGCTTPSNTVGMDVDILRNENEDESEYQKRLAAIPEKVLEKKEELGLLMLERSATKGYHLVFKRREGLTQVGNLRWASELLGVEFDQGAKDITRVFFTTTASEEDLMYLDDELFEQKCAEGATEHSTESEPCVEDTQSSAMSPIQDSDNVEDVCSDSQDLNYDGIPYRLIVEALEDQLGGVPVHGSRNQFVFSMACQLRYVCNHDAEWVAKVLPDYGEAREKWMNTIRSACSRSQNKLMPKALMRALDMAKVRNECENDACDNNGVGYDGSGNGTAPPLMPKNLPPLIKLLVSKTPKIYQPAVAHAVFPALGTHLWKTRFRYIDNVEHEATLMNVLMACSGAGKNCITAPINCILKDIRERDKLSLKKECMWKEEMLTTGENMNKRKRPEGIVVQEVDADMTNAAFVLRMSEADEHFLYVKMNEIEQFDALKTTARSKSQFQIMCLAFDPGNTYGQTRVGTQSVSARVCIRFNWNASTTIQKGQQYFHSVLTDGPISRINFCTIPEQPIGAEMPVYGTYDAEFESMLKPYIDRLNAARGLIECPQASQLARKLMEENADFARLSRSRTFENLSFRANVIAFLKAMVLYVAQGERWDQTLEDFVRWSEQYDMWCKMHFFGEDIEAANGHVRKPKRGPKNLLEELPDVFTIEEAMTVRRKQNLASDLTASMLANWKSRGYIAEKKRGERDVIYVKLRK